MDLTFHSISVEGFRSFRKRSAISLSPGLHYVRGQNLVEPNLSPNGAGKSSIFHALSWALYGRSPGNLKGPDIKPWRGGSTKVTVRVGEHKITRSINPNQILLNDEQTNQETIVEALGGLSYELFSHTMLLGQGQPLFFDLQPKDKMQLFSDVLKLTRWEDRADKASERVKEVEARKANLENELTGILRSLEELNDFKSRLKAQREEWDDERQKRSKNVDAEIKKLEKQLIPAQRRLDDASMAADSAGTELKALQREAEKADQELREANQDRDRSRIDLENKSKQLTSLKKQLAQLENNRKCPTCGQSVKKADLSEHRKEITNQLLELRDVVEKGIPGSVDKRYEKARSNAQKIFNHLTTFREKEEKATAEIDLYRPQVTELVVKIKQLKELRHPEEVNPYLQQLRILKRKKGTLEGEADDVRQLLGKQEAMIERAKYWVKGFKDVRLFIIEEVLAELELATNSMLEEIGLVGWEVQYAIEKETKAGTFQRGLNVTIKSPSNDEPVKWECWSGGEGQRLRLIGALALSEVLLNEANINPNLEILDEPSRGMARRGVNDLVSILSYRASNLNKAIFYVDHQVVENSNFTSTITVVKDEAGSYIQK